MDLSNIPLPLTGDVLMDRLKNSKNKRKVIADGLLYEKTSLMIAADPGTGKSTVSAQVAVELAGGFPVFGFFNVPKPVKVLYIQTERSILELLERIETLSKILPVVKENLVVTDEYQRLDLLNPTHANLFLKAVKRDYGGARVVFLDPIYSTVSGGLKSDEPASAFTKVMSHVQKELDCALWYNHHTTKTTYKRDGSKLEKDDPFYGSQWLKAHVTGSYYMKATREGVTLVLKKDNYRLLSPSIALEYDPETELCSVISDKLPAIDKLRNFIQVKKSDGKAFSFKDIQSYTKLGNRTIRELLLHSSISDSIIVVSSIRNKNLYKIGTG